MLITAGGYHYDDRTFNRTDVVAEMVDALPTVERLILMLQLLGEISRTHLPEVHDQRDPMTNDMPLIIIPTAADHPLWIPYSPGTTDMPKPIMYGYGDSLLVQMIMSALHLDLNPNDVYH